MNFGLRVIQHSVIRRFYYRVKAGKDQMVLQNQISMLCDRLKDKHNFKSNPTLKTSWTKEDFITNKLTLVIEFVEEFEC
jgi:hypothetical protein